MSRAPTPVCEEVGTIETLPKRLLASSARVSSDTHLSVPAVEARVGRHDIRLMSTTQIALLDWANGLATKQPFRERDERIRLACSLLPDSISAIFIELLLGLGYDVRVASCTTLPAQRHTIAALAEAHVEMYAPVEPTDEGLEAAWAQMTDGWNPMQVVDYNGKFSVFLSRNKRLHDTFLVLALSSIAYHKIHTILRVSSHKFALYSIHRTRLFQALQPRSLAMATTTALRTLVPGGAMSGFVVIVVGYETVGKLVCESLRAIGCRVAVAETEPSRAWLAALDGYAVCRLSHLIASSLIHAVIFTTLAHDPLSKDDLQNLPGGAVVFNACPLRDSVTSKIPPKWKWIQLRLGEWHLIHKKHRVIIPAQGAFACTVVGPYPGPRLAGVSFSLALSILTATASHPPQPGSYQPNDETLSSVATCWLAHNAGITKIDGLGRTTRALMHHYEKIERE